MVEVGRGRGGGWIDGGRVCSMQEEGDQESGNAMTEWGMVLEIAFNGDA
jgi:hypothetical protein